MRIPILLLIAVPLLLPAQAPAQAPVPSFRSTTSEVMLDLVVRDKHGKIIHNLRPDEVQVFEDGVLRPIRHFEFVDGHSDTPVTPAISAAAPPPASSASSAPASPDLSVKDLRDISVISVVIADMDPRGRKLTLDAMSQFAKTAMQPNTYIGVFSLGMAGLRYIQPYTNDSAKVSAAIERAVRSAMNNQLTAVAQQNSRDTSLGAADTAAGGTTDPSSLPSTDPNGNVFGTAAGPTGSTSAAGAGPATEINSMMESTWVSEMQDVYFDSQRYLTPLRTLVQAQAEIPGRKVVLLFSAGLPVHGDSVELLNSVISAANRSNVSIYALDTRGVTTQSTLDYSRNLLQRAARMSMNQQLSPDKTVTPGEVIAGEMAEGSIHADTRGNLQELAEGTGGELLPDSLDLLKPLEKAVEDVRTHYELTYSPVNTALDGTFRKIQVKVSRHGARVFARSGYYSLPVLNGQQVYPFELATLNALNANPAPHQFGMRAEALQFRPGPEQTQFAYVFQAPTRGLTVATDGSWAKVHVSVTALVKNDQGQVVDKISKDIPYEVPKWKKSDLQRGVISFTAHFLLPAGRYTVETAAVDRQSAKASVTRSPLLVTQNSSFSMSDVVAARRVDPASGLFTASDPLQTRGGRITPELSETTAPDGRGELKLYAVAYPPAPVDSPLHATVEIWQNGRLAMRSPGSDVPLDADGGASILAEISTRKFRPGRYNAQVVFEYKGQTVSKTIPFTVAAGTKPGA